MNDDTQLSREGPAGGLSTQAASVADLEQRVQDPYRRAHRALRGRWATVVALGVCCATVGAVIGWKLGKPIYESEGLVQIEYAPQPVMAPIRTDREPVEIFQAILSSQQALLSSRRIVDLAMQEADWRGIGRPVTPETTQQFASGLKVEHRPATDYIRVVFADPEPVAAAAAVRSVLSAYSTVYSGQESRFSQQRVEALRQRQEHLRGQLATLRGESQKLADGISLASTEGLYDAAAVQFRKIQETLTDIRLAQVLSRENRGLMTLSQISVVDPTMATFLREREALVSELASLERRGFGSSHPMLNDLRERLEQKDAQIDAFTHEYRSMQAGGGLPGAPAPTFLQEAAKRPREQLEVEAQGINRLWDEARRTVETLANRRTEAEAIKAEMSSVSEQLASVTREMERLSLESGVNGRLKVITSGEVPISPVVDQRKQFAMAGAATGGLLPLTAFALVGLLGRGYRWSNETEDELSPHMPLLGILPQLPDRLRDPAQAADAAQGLHQIRVMLQGAAKEGRAVFLVTSASAGEGKTSLVASLGLSFAASGSRTLLIDCDLLGQWLSHGFKQEDHSGLREALADGNLMEHIRATSSANLFILPVGQADMRHASVLSGRAMQRLLAEARERFDVVLVDSGPVLGSVETAVIAPQADGVVLVIARNQQRPAVDRAVRSLHGVGARLAGMIFNRAELKDLYRSVSCSSARSVRVRPVDARSLACSDETSRFGPLVRSVACLLPKPEPVPAGDQPDDDGHAI